MLNCILSFLSKKHPYPFGKEYRKAYKNNWINNIKDYTP